MAQIKEMKGLYENSNFKCIWISWIFYKGLKNQVLNFLNFLSSRVLLSYKKKTYTIVELSLVAQLNLSHLHNITSLSLYRRFYEF